MSTASFPVRMIDLSFSVYHYDLELASHLRRHLDDFVLYAPPRERDPSYPFLAPLPPIKGLTVTRYGLGAEERLLGISGVSLDYIFNQGYSLLSLLSSRPTPLVHIQFLSFLQKQWFDVQWLQAVKRFSSRLVYTVHNVLPQDRKDDPALKKRYRRVYHIVDHLIVHTERQKKELLQSFAIPESKVTIIPHGVLFSHLPLPEKTEARRILAIKEAPVLFHFGSMRPYKGTENLLHAFAKLRAQIGSGTLILGGRAAESRRNQLLTLIHELNLQKHILCRFDFIPATDLAVYFAAADLAVLPYLQIDQSGALLTAMSLGIPVVVTSVGSFPQLIEKHDFGFMCQQGSMESLTATLAEAAGDLQGAQAKAAKAKQYVHEHYDWDVIARQTIEVYTRLLS